MLPREQEQGIRLMRRFHRVAGVLTAGALVWSVLSTLGLGESERFYLVAPPVSLGLMAARSQRGWKALRNYLLFGIPFLLTVAVLATAYMRSLTAPSQSDNIDPVLHGVRPGAVLLSVYFVSAVVLLALLVRSSIVPLWLALLDRLLGRAPVSWLWLRRTLVELNVGLILVPFPMAAFYVHRLKVPNRALPAALVGRRFEEVQFHTVDGLTLRGWFIHARRGWSSQTVLICHGMGANRSSVLDHLPVADAVGANALFFDFRGHGESDGHTVTFGYRERFDVLAAVRYLRERRPEQARVLIGLGISMGSAALIGAAAEMEPPFAAVIVDSGFASVTEASETIFAYLPACLRYCLVTPAMYLASLDAGCWLADVRPAEDVRRLRAPLLVIHSLGDRLVPVKQGQRLHACAVNPKTLWLTDTGDHCSAIQASAAYGERVRRMLARTAE